MLPEQWLEIVPRHGTQDLMTSVVEPSDMGGGVGAAVGDQQQGFGSQVILQELELLTSGGH